MIWISFRVEIDKLLNLTLYLVHISKYPPPRINKINNIINNKATCANWSILIQFTISVFFFPRWFSVEINSIMRWSTGKIKNIFYSFFIDCKLIDKLDIVTDCILYFSSTTTIAKAQQRGKVKGRDSGVGSEQLNIFCIPWQEKGWVKREKTERIRLRSRAFFLSLFPWHCMNQMELAATEKTKSVTANPPLA